MKAHELIHITSKVKAKERTLKQNGIAEEKIHTILNTYFNDLINNK